MDELFTCWETAFFLCRPFYHFIEQCPKIASSLKVKLKKPRDVKGGLERQCWCACSDTVENHWRHYKRPSFTDMILYFSTNENGNSLSLLHFHWNKYHFFNTRRELYTFRLTTGHQKDRLYLLCENIISLACSQSLDRKLFISKGWK